MSPKFNSLALEEIQEIDLRHQANKEIDSQLNYLLGRTGSTAGSYASNFAASEDVVRIGGRIVVSF